ncbi:unnamed protein product [Rotaria sordida]|uniref:Uncharacterized protein n=1 Tax=Rotaria sordida TaxID=392033 RepID=A0A819M8X2_9BILA|nr:unnamed protein product [Rotaria sordida]CAF3976046.1 unnamed protein product [Rotaria sordida]CAF3981578.1 unnamed protein product [Rotaria sordida]
MVTISDGTESICIIFGKNCDCQSNEPLSIRYIPSAVHVSNSKVQTTYIAIDQIEKMNSSLFTKIASDFPGLTGMDVVRLALERCCTSKDEKNTNYSLVTKIWSK